MSMEPSTGMNVTNILDVQYQIFMDKFISRFFCHGCKESFAFSSLTQCVNGHGVCSACTSKNKNKCPYPDCKTNKLSPIDSLTKEVVECFPVMCKEKFCRTLTFQQSVHEKQCSLATTGCKLCDAYVLRKDLINHIMNCHPKKRIYKAKNLGISWKDLHPNRLAGSNSYVPIYVDGYFFWLEITNTPNDKLISFKYSYVSNGQKDFNFLITFSLKNPTRAFVEYSYLSMDRYLKKEDMNVQFCMHFSTFKSLTSGKHEIKLCVEKIVDDEI